MDHKKEQKNPNLRFMNKKRGIPASAGFTIFIVISCFVIAQDVLAFDTVIREYIYGLRSEGLTSFFTAITYLGNWETVALLCFLFLLIPRTRLSIGVPASIAALAAVGIQKALKVSFHRARPDLELHLISQGGFSFPSGHSFTVLIFYGMLIFFCRQNIKDKRASNLITVLLSGLIFGIGFSRIYLGVHYPTDVLGGWSLGLCVLLVMISVMQSKYTGLSWLQRKKD